MRHHQREGHHQPSSASVPMRADQPELLRDHGEDEVRLLLGQEVQVPLRALQEALAPEPAGAQRDLGLDDVVAGAQRVASGSRKVVMRARW
jgi:hypothetical protein